MKKVLLSLSTLALLALGACTNNDAVAPSTGEQKAVTGRPMTIKVGRGDASTKINVSDDLKLTWSKGDSISVAFFDDDNEKVYNEIFTLIDGDGKTTGTFYCESSELPGLSEDKGKAVDVTLFYPYYTSTNFKEEIPDLTQSGALGDIGKHLFMAGTSTVNGTVMAECTMTPKYVVLKLGKDKQLFDSGFSGNATKIVVKDLNETLSGGVIDNMETTVGGTFTISGGKLADDVYVVMAGNSDETTPNIRVTMTVDGTDYMFVVTRSSIFEAGHLYSMPITEESQYITFADKNVEKLCVKTWGNNTGKLTYAQAAAVTATQLGTLFNSTSIESFNELQYFTGLTEIPDDAFDACSSLESITLPGSVTSIGGYAFYECTALPYITIPDGVTTIGTKAFYGCTKLNVVTCEPIEVPTLSSDSFEECSALEYIYVYTGVVDDYKKAENWSTYASKIQAKTNEE